MATLPYCFFSLIVFLWTGHTGTNAQPSDCNTTTCGSHSVPVRFPFWLNEANQSGNRCGYPGFELKCDNKNQPLLTLPESGDFIVKVISNQDQKIWINVEPDECLPRRIMLGRGFSLAGSPFQLGSAFTLANYSFYNCPYNTTTSSYMVQSIRCLSHTGNINYSVLAVLSNPPHPTPCTNSCHLISSALVPVPRIKHDLYWTRYFSDIQLQWDEPNCGACEQRGGLCGFVGDSSDQVACYNLPDQGQGLSTKVKYGLTIGLGMPGLIGVIGLACLFRRWMRMHNHRHRHRQMTEFSSMSNPYPPVVVTGLDGASIERYPKTQLGDSGRLPNPNDATCSICLCEYQPKEVLRTITECSHYFHVDCIDGWLKMNASCPLCRNLPWRSSSSSSSLPFSPTSS